MFSSSIKVSDLAKFLNVSMPLISRHFKNHDDKGVVRTKGSKRIIGVLPEAVESYFKEIGFNYFNSPAITLSANLCGGVGKTTSILNLAACMRRITSRLTTPIVCIDGDPQGSFTSLIFGSPATDDEPILIDYLENRAKLEDVLTDLGNNVWFIKSNLGQILLDKLLDKPQAIKRGMLRLYQEIFDKLGNKTKIFQDHTPYLSSFFASSVCALKQLDNDILKSVVIPIRSDNQSIQGAQYIIKEIKELSETFGLHNNLNIHCFFSCIDNRISTTETVKINAKAKVEIVPYLNLKVIRYCSEIPKTLMSTNTNVFSSGRKNNAAEDYQELLRHIFTHR